jgi:hypothetical protein
LLTGLLWCGGVSLAAQPSAPTGLYEGRTVVNLYPDLIQKGYAADLEQVLIKVSGDPRLAGDPRLKPALDNARAYAGSVTYIDKRGGSALHDEQGSRDRAHDMRVTFDPDKIAGLLFQVSHTPWTEPRPVVTVYAALRDVKGRITLLSVDGADCADQRESLAAASDLRALPVRLSDRESLAAAHAGFRPFTDHHWRPPAGGPALVGVIDWDAEHPGWIISWRLVGADIAVSWSGRAETYDEAFRHGISGAELVLSGNGNPARRPD